MERFNVCHSAEGLWHPLHNDPDLHSIRFQVPPESQMTEEQVREALFELVDAKFPGRYSLDWDLEEVRGRVLSKVDLRSDELLQGFTYQDIVFSLSPKAQIRYEFMDRTATELPYPLPINSLDDRDMVVLNTPADTRAFCKASTEHVFNIVGSGTIEKNKIRAMTSVDELLAYVDPR